ncbi:MAG: Exc2 family lipoprotein [Enterobacterales bacterium]|nr:Exc2 family lipoprotein [Enterobacterales bacterium]MDN6682167.1 Exc2 family lipoprotein [Enterobacterales bacterium]
MDGIQRKEDFAGKSYSQLQTQKWRMLMSQEAAGAYMDGYNGVK